MEEGKKGNAKFPNIAGFCRYLGCGTAALAQLEDRYPDQADLLLAIFEDETLNAALSPTLLSAYLKKRLGYADKTVKGEQNETECGLMRLVFEHDIEEDGE